MSLLVIEHDWIDGLNAASTLVIAVFTVAMFLVVKYQLQASKDIERAWVIPHLGVDPFSALFICENTSTQNNQHKVSTAASLQLKLRNHGRGPVWIKELRARMVVVDSIEALPTVPKLSKEDIQQWYPAPFVDEASARFTLSVDGHVSANMSLVVYGDVSYLDTFREERSSTFGYVINQRGNIERLKTHSEYNRNT